ncbi:hypothetical protein GQ600_26015 [Phytophthora cactorum]|nr:hypothetical protein GQ600_26015 [Phytophthora cactorum]
MLSDVTFVLAPREGDGTTHQARSIVVDDDASSSESADSSFCSTDESENSDVEDARTEPFETATSFNRTVIQLNGYQYTIARESSRKITFRCSFYRISPGCKGKVDFNLLSV